MAGYAIRQVEQLPFSHLIGGPMSAAIEAQAQAAATTIDFMRQVGFAPAPDSEPDEEDNPDIGAARTISFNYSVRTEDNPDEERDVSLTVPVLSIVPIPYIRIDEMSIDFTAKISELQQHKSVAKSEQTEGRAYRVKAKFKFWRFSASASMSGSLSSSHSQSSTQSSKYKTELTMNVHVRAVQDDMPAGMSRVLSILEKTITERPKPVADTVSGS